jgi:Leucine-rich repeat (LRR) protein
MTNLSVLVLQGNQLTSLTLPPDMTNLTALSFLGNPLTTLVLSEPLVASTNLDVNFTTVDSLRSQGLAVVAYRLTVALIPPRQIVGGRFDVSVTGPPGVYTLFGSADLSAWSELDVGTNTLGNVRFTDAAPVAPQKFYMAQLRGAPLAPANMVFVTPPNSFTLGSPNNEVGH